MTNPMSFAVWKSCLRDDCEKHGNLAAFNILGDYVLNLLWESGLEPTMTAASNLKTFSQPATHPASKSPSY
ncbi:MAG TPA: hypothetical protein VND65_00770 [Candidatus Binatia bacterium]|nr:hypothetical protein [Candidatus Binatia bacterium]